MKEYMKRLSDYFDGGDYNLVDSSPLFPDYLGNVIKKAGMVATIEQMASKTGERLTNSAGTRRFGGHSMRVTGSRFWARAGLEVFKIQIFARWGSSVILRYVSDVPIANLTGEICSSQRVEEPALRSLVAKLDQHIKCAQEQNESLRAELKRLESSVNPQLVQNSHTKVWHAVLVCGITYPPAMWRSCCGWKFGQVPHSLSATHPPPASNFCDRSGCAGRLLAQESGPSSEGSSFGLISSADESG